MILILLAIICTSIVCWGWGFIFFKILQGVVKQEEILQANFVITCFSGLAFIGVVFSILSLFVPMGGMVPQILLIIPVASICTRYQKTCVAMWFSALKKTRELSALILILLAACVLLVLLMGSFTISHPDTLVYHAQCIQWLQDYKTIPGLANLGYHYGLQSSWFVLSALFSFKFAAQTMVPYLNCTAVIWLIIFVCVKCSEFFSGRPNTKNATAKGLLWLVFLTTCFWSYTQVRLTVTSLSPDFIAALYTWLIFFLVIEGESSKNEAKVLLIIFLSLFAITVKLSALPVILPALYFYYRNQSGRVNMASLRLVICGMLVLIPVLVRNVITTGYPLFPSPVADVFQADWKMPIGILFDRLEYIKSYARFADSAPVNTGVNNADLGYSIWIPVWWKNQSLADKCLLSGLTFLMIASVVVGTKRSRPALPFLWPLVFSIAGVIFWFTQAPDPRFGFGFITSSAGLMLLFLLSAFTKRIEIPRYWLNIGLISFTAIMFSYSTYRIMNFFAWHNIVMPSGIAALPSATIRCEGININIPANDQGCGATSLPCAYNKCGEFVPRGESLGDGFKPGNLAGK